MTAEGWFAEGFARQVVALRRRPCVVCGRVFSPMANDRIPVHGPRRQPCAGSKLPPAESPAIRIRHNDSEIRLYDDP
jgi:hypothetical protein